MQTLKNLVPKRPTIALDFGTGMHEALEAYYLGAGEGEHDLNAAHLALDKWDARQIAKLDDGDFPPEVYEEQIEHFDLGHAMLENYVRFDKAAKVQLGDVLAVEGQPVGEPSWKAPSGYPPPVLHESGRLLVPIVDPHTGEALPRGPMLSMRIDLLTQRKTPKKGLWVVDHKTSGSQPQDRGWDFDDQVTGYCYGVWRYTGIIPRGVVANFLIKDVPKPPRMVRRRGSKDPEDTVLSTAKDQLTTPDMYRAALKDEGLIMPGSGRVATDEHAACMEALLERGWDPFFRRFEPTRNEHELMAFERRLYAEYHDMCEASDEGDLRMYPNLDSRICTYCPVNRICHAMEDGSDWEGVIETEYMQGEDRKAAR